MAWTSVSLRRAAGLGVGILGVIALFVVSFRLVPGPAVSAQTYDLRAQLVGGASIGVDVRDAEAVLKRPVSEPGIVPAGLPRTPSGYNRRYENLTPDGTRFVRIGLADYGVKSWPSSYGRLTPADVSILGEAPQVLRQLTRQCREALTGAARHLHVHGDGIVTGRHTFGRTRRLGVFLLLGLLLRPGSERCNAGSFHGGALEASRLGGGGLREQQRHEHSCHAP